MRSTSSPDSWSLLIVSMMGNPAPTVASCSTRRPRDAADRASPPLDPRRAASGILLARTMSIPPTTAASSTAVVSPAVTSTRIGRDKACRRTSASADSALARTPFVMSASAVPASFALASMASCRFERPRGSKTYPLVSMTATTRSARDRATATNWVASSRPIRP